MKAGRQQVQLPMTRTYNACSLQDLGELTDPTSTSVFQLLLPLLDLGLVLGCHAKAKTIV